MMSDIFWSIKTDEVQEIAKSSLGRKMKKNELNRLKTQLNTGFKYIRMTRKKQEVMMYKHMYMIEFFNRYGLNGVIEIAINSLCVENEAIG